MSEAIAFDTHRFVKRLTESGFTEKQAETLAEEHVALLNANLATKADVEVARADIARVEAGIEALRQETKASIEALRQETKAAIEAVKVDLLKWLFGALIAQGGLIVGIRSVRPWRFERTALVDDRVAQTSVVWTHRTQPRAGRFHGLTERLPSSLWSSSSHEAVRGREGSLSCIHPHTI